MVSPEASTSIRSPHELLDLTPKTIFLTGGSGDLGQVIIRRLGGEYNIIAPGRQELDLSDSRSIQRYTELHVEDPIDIIINNAATNPATPPLDEMSFEQIEEIFRINEMAPLWLSIKLINHMMEQK